MSSAAGKRLERWVKLSVVPPVGAWVIRCLGRSMRIESQGHEAADQLYQAGTRAIFAFWHARQLLMPFAYRGERAHVLISQHQDGEIIARIVERFGFLAVRGSSTRGGVEALRELIRLGHSGADLVVTPDGPKGPAQVAKIGVIQLARATGLPIVPITAACSKKLFASWDRFMLPWPWSRGLFLWGGPLWVSRAAGPEELEAKRVELEVALNRLTVEADEAVLRQPPRVNRRS